MSLCSLCSLLNLLWMSVCFPIAQQGSYSCCSSYYRLSALSDSIFNYTVYEWYVMSIQHVRPHTAPTYKSNVNLSAPRVPVFSWRGAPPKSRAAQYWKKNNLNWSHICDSETAAKVILLYGDFYWEQFLMKRQTFHSHFSCLHRMFDRKEKKKNSFLCRYDNGPSYL